MEESKKVHLQDEKWTQTGELIMINHRQFQVVNCAGVLLTLKEVEHGS